LRPRATVAGAVVLVAALTLPGRGVAQENKETHAAMLLVLDASGSMNADDGSGRPKIDAAKDALRGLVDSLPPGAPVGLRVYGHRVPNTDKANGCRDTELVAPVAPLDRDRMKAAIGSFPAKGFTPIGLSLQEAAKDLPEAPERTVVLVSDGVDTCAPPDPCQVARDLIAQGVKLKVETVGFQVDAAARDQLRCIAAATGGAYVDAPDAARLGQSLSTISKRALRAYVTRGIPVTGGLTRETAQAIAEGQHLFSMGLGEDRWFAVSLKTGQALSAAATLTGHSAFARPSDYRYLELAVHGPTGKRATFELVRLSDEPDTARIQTPPVGIRDPNPGLADEYDDVGVYYVRLTDNKDDATPGVRLEVELTIGISGEAASPATTTAAAGSLPSSRTAAEEVSTGERVANALVAALVGLCLGAGVAWVAGRRRVGS
jgi:Ca-activated chloride channel family protein